MHDNDIQSENDVHIALLIETALIFGGMHTNAVLNPDTTNTLGDSR